MQFLSLAALKVAILTTSSAVSDENFVKMTPFLFQCIWTDGKPSWFHKHNIIYAPLLRCIS